MARFANVAFSDGSLLHGFNQRINKKQPIVAPNDIKRYFITPKESGELCLMSCIYGSNRDIFFPKLDENLNLISFSDIAIKYLAEIGFEPYFCSSEEEARKLVDELVVHKKWPCLFNESDTTGEKSFEEFYTEDEIIDTDRFENIGIVKNNSNYSELKLENFTQQIGLMKSSCTWTKKLILDLFYDLIPNFVHKETGKYLDSKM